MPKKIDIIGYGSGIAGSNTGSADGPAIIKKSSLLHTLNPHLQWDAIFQSNPDVHSKQTEVVRLCQLLANAVADKVQQKKFFTVLGGDHTCAIGTWSGATSEISPLGLIWIDAHMDSHNPETSHTGNIHGMPLACLLGVGDATLTKILGDSPKLQPEHVCLIGIRSYESEELALLKKLNVRIFFMEEVKQRGLSVIMQEALQIVTTGTKGFGISIDIDSMDPIEAPGTGVPEPDGLSAQSLIAGLHAIAQHSQLIGIEIAEFNPHLDQAQKTEKIIMQLLQAVIA